MMVSSSSNDKQISGFFRGQVLKHLPHGRCKIFIPSIHDQSWINNPDLLPDAEQASPLFAGTNAGNGVFSYPNLSSIVWCFFENNDQNYPVYFASTLGGSNAFGQYEIIMPSRYVDGNTLKQTTDTVVESNKHLITSGHSQLEIYESGKISAYVSDPQRRDATVDNNNTYQLQRQDDHVIDRSVWEQIEAKEISSINCQLVLDNHDNGGEISSSTYKYVPYSSTISNTDLVTGITTTKTVNGQEEAQYKKINNNNLDYANNALSTCELNTIYVAMQGTEVLTAYTNVSKDTVANAISSNSNANAEFYTSIDINDVYSQTKPIISNKTVIETAKSTFNIDNRTITVSNVDKLTKVDTTADLILLTSNVENSILLNNQTGISLTNTYNYSKTISTGTITEVNETKINNLNNNGVSLVTDIKSTSIGTKQRNTTYVNNLQTQDPTLDTIFSNNLNEYVYNDKVDISNVCSHKSILTSPNVTTIQEFNCTGNKIVLDITGENNANITFDSSTGDITLDATNSLTFKIAGKEVMKITEGKIDITGEVNVTKDVTCKDCVANCSLNNHVHPYAWTDGAGSDDTSVGK